MINKTNVRDVIITNRKLVDEIASKVELIFSKGLHFRVKPLQSIQNYLFANTQVILAPSKSLSYGGMILYRNNTYYLHINTLQPKTYENFVWAHELYHYEFEKERIQNADEPTFINNPVLDLSERKANLFAAELLINSNSLKVFFESIKQQNPNDALETNIIRLIPYFELPYKSLVIKLAQDDLITIEEAENMIDFDYRNNLPRDFDLSILKPAKSIRIDNLNALISKVEKSGVMHESEIASIKKTRDNHIEALERLRHSTQEE